jgi:hypothetical protein
LDASSKEITMNDDYAACIMAMWKSMQGLAPAEFARFTSLVARQISECIDDCDISTATDRDTLLFMLPMPFAIAMADAHVPGGSDLPMLPEPAASLCRDAAAACNRLAAPDAGAELPIALGSQAATAVLEGVDESAYMRWAIYRSYLEVLLNADPLPPETERAALAMFQSGLRVSGVV